MSGIDVGGRPASAGLVELFTRAKASGDHAAITGAIPYARWLGITTENLGGELVCVMRYQDMLVGNPGVPALHGGTMAALLETAAVFQVLWEMETVTLPKTITLTVDYLRSARPVDTYARAVITKSGRRVANVRAEAWQESRERPMVSANLHFLVLPTE